MKNTNRFVFGNEECAELDSGPPIRINGSCRASSQFRFKLLLRMNDLFSAVKICVSRCTEKSAPTPAQLLVKVMSSS